MLLAQRNRDYLNEGVHGIDPVTVERNQQFYRDTDALRGYGLVYRSPVGLVYIRDNLCICTTPVSGYTKAVEISTAFVVAPPRRLERRTFCSASRRSIH